jgi:hypothetical protein
MYRKGSKLVKKLNNYFVKVEELLFHALHSGVPQEEKYGANVLLLFILNYKLQI